MGRQLATLSLVWQSAGMDTLPTLILALACAVFAALCGWRGARPPDLKAGPRLVPWRLLMLTAGAAAILLFLQAVRTSGLLASGQ